jgi:hypothetical protein
MCDAMREPPRPGTELFCFWREEPIPEEGEHRDLELGEWKIPVRILKVKDPTYVPMSDCKFVTMEVIG